MSLQRAIVGKIAALEKERKGSRRVEVQKSGQHAWSHACSTVLALPALRGFWPMSSVDYTNPQATDLCAHGYDLTNNNTSLFGHDGLAPYVEFDGTNQYLSRADGGAGNWADILGTETYIEPTQRGLTMGGWFYFDDATPAANERFMGKIGFANIATLAYMLQRQPNTVIRFVIGDGVATFPVGTTATAISTWYFIVGRFVPSASVDVFVNTTEENAVAGIPAAIQDTARDFTIGASDIPDSYQDGKASMCFLCAAALSDTIIQALYAQTRALYGV